MLQGFLADYSFPQITDIEKHGKYEIFTDIFDYFESLDVINNYQVRRDLPQVLNSKF